MEESAFRKNWSWFGFEGQPDCSTDYSWFKIQDSLIFMGIENTVSHCSLYSSSRHPNHFLIKSPSTEDEIWDATDCIFSNIPEIPSSLEISAEKRCFILWGVSKSLILLLIRDRKLPQSAIDSYPNPDCIPAKYTRTTSHRSRSPSIPESSSMESTSCYK